VTYARARGADGSLVDLAPVTAPPYDVIDDEHRAVLEARDPNNVVRLTLPRSDDGRAGYPAARAELDAWLSKGVLTQAGTDSLLVYEVTEGTHVTRGLVSAVGLTRPEAGVILPHESTMKGPVEDRLALTAATEANLEPIMLAYQGRPGALRDLLGETPQDAQIVAYADVDGAVHRVWAEADPQMHRMVSEDLHAARVVIADGHHRYATSLAYQDQRHRQGAGSGPWDSTLAWLLDTDAWGPQVAAIHRVLPGLALSEARQAASAVLSVSFPGSAEAALRALADGLGTGERRFVLTDGTEWVLLSGFESPDVQRAMTAALPADRSPAWRSLDVTVLHHYMVGALWGLEDDENTVWYRHDVDEALTAARSSAGTAVLLNPTPAHAVSEVAAAGDRMPRKSTLYLPKPRSGLVMRLIR
jgi:uncharacterized protein (DUF1015 family)